MRDPQVGEPDFRLLFETSPSVLLLLSPELAVLAATDGFLRVTHTERAQIVGRNMFEVFPGSPDAAGAASAEVLRRSIERALATRLPDTIEQLSYHIEVVTEKGVELEERVWSVLNTPVLAANGRVSMIMQRVQDVSELVQQRRKQQHELQVEVAELARVTDALEKTEEQLRGAELRAAREALELAQNVFNRFFTLSIDLMCICGTDGYFRRVNPAFAKVLGYTEQDLLSAPLVEFMHPDDRPRTVANLRKLERGLSTSGSENRYRCKDGSYRWFAWNSAPEPDGTIYAIGRDVTEDKRVYHELLHARTVAENANRELESFSYTVAHDLRAPLRSIDGFSLALLEDYSEQLDDKAQGYLNRVRAGAQRMALLIDDLLALSRLSRGELRIEPIDLTRIARDVVEQLRQTQPARSVQVQIAAGMTVHADAHLMTNALENLIGNAWKYTGKRADAQIEIGVSLGDDEQRTFYVRDNGAGFDMTYQHKLFNAFQRLHKAEEFEGTGIGLASVQRVINRHGGRIWPEAEVGKGATFYFTLPDE